MISRGTAEAEDRAPDERLREIIYGAIAERDFSSTDSAALAVLEIAAQMLAARLMVVKRGEMSATSGKPATFGKVRRK